MPGVRRISSEEFPVSSFSRIPKVRTPGAVSSLKLLTTQMSRFMESSGPHLPLALHAVSGPEGLEAAERMKGDREMKTLNRCAAVGGLAVYSGNSTFCRKVALRNNCALSEREWVTGVAFL